MIYSAPFLRRYHQLPHALINRGFALVTRAERPRWLVQTAIARWIERDAIDMSQFESRDFASLEDFFLRELRQGARPLGPGLVAPVDGRVVARGAVTTSETLLVKGHRISLDRLLNGARPRAHAAAPPLTPYRDGQYISLFLSPRGYHYVHMPEDGVVREARWLPGRFFPQNEIALRHIPDVYEQNERLVLRLELDRGSEALLVMVGASLIGGIQLALAPRAAFTQPEPLRLSARLAKGERIGHFSFGSTVILIVPRGIALARALGEDVRLGESLAS